MGMLVEGDWIDDDAKYRNAESGAFVRPESNFRRFITADGSSEFPAEANRYHLFLAPNCPWAHRTQLVRRIKGLEEIISISMSDLPRTKSWAYSEGIGNGLDPIDGVFELYQAYQAADTDYTGRVTVPTLWDKKDWTVVNNESSEIIRMLNTEFNDWGDASIDLYPEALREEIDQYNDRIYGTLNNGVYRCGFAKSQEAYDEAYHNLFETLEWLEDHLGTNRYLCGNVITEADWRLYTTLVRFDVVYYGHFKCNKFRICDQPNLWNYLKDLYQRPGIAAITDMEGIKRGYWGDMPNVNPSGIVPLGPEDFDLTETHNRDGLGQAA
ncbi:MAG: glutathione-dependent reductase [Rhodospirillaceae bacterium]|mgnify:FL=1|nr:glutathione-dependent reductase [Rhodospirillaceae bacterium]|tara:strand:- start:7818 stop:8792 length:975 start_codon:yes stop_codon:yes gene_type:complete